MTVGKYIFGDWYFINGFGARSIHQINGDPASFIRIYLSYQKCPDKILVEQNEFPYSDIYFKLYGQIPFDDLESAKAHIDEFLFKMKTLGLFI